MKLLKYLGIFLILIVAVLYGLLFTGFGNNLVKPYIEKTVKDKSGFDLKLTKFDLNFKSLDISAIINGEINADVKGKYSLFSQSFDLDYNVDVQNLNSFKVNLDEPMGLNGLIRGKIKDFSANGVGKILDSDVRFLATLKDFKPFDVDLDAKGLNVQKAMKLANQPAFLVGKINAVANIQNGFGEANITSNDLAINKDGLKDKNITIPNNIAIDLNSDITLKDNIITASSNLNSKLANLEAKETKFNLDNKNLESDFSLDILDLANLEPFTKQKLNGNLKVDGFTKVVDNKPEFVKFNLVGFGGEVNANLQDKILDAKINSIKIAELMGVASMPKAVSGVINGEIKINDVYDFNNIQGSAILNVIDGKINPVELKKMANLDFPQNNNFEIASKTLIENGIVDSVSNLASNLFKIDNLKAIYNLKEKDLKADFKASVDDLSKLKEFTKQTLKGNLKASGDVSMKNNALKGLNLNVNTLGGEIKASSNGSNLNADVNNLKLNDIFALIGQNPLASGDLKAKINLSNIDIKNLNGTANINLSNSILNDKELSKMLNKEFPKNIKLNANSDINIANSIANFNAIINSDLANLKKLNGSFDINKNFLNANYEAFVNDLSKLAFVTGKKMIGSVGLNGEIKKDAKNLVATANSDLFDGKFKANLTNENLKATFDKFKISKLTHMLNFGEFYEGIGDLVFNYNTLAQKGDFNVDINEGRLTPSKLTTAISIATQKDITKEIFNDSYVKGVINQGLVEFKSQMKAPKMDLNVTKGTLDTKTSKINIPVLMNIEKTDIAADVTGTTKDPKVNVSSKYLEQKLDKVIDKGLDKLLGGKKNNVKDDNSSLNNDENSEEDSLKDGVKNLLKGFF
ncbi:AsmA-like C-terminal region-containing protein [Campylobacter ureolyticus]|uniref:AsmA-like C-terminal region-containing protein n=1 Tax=Campylobacter ureolyticus TaxID=827 RepID=UPI001FC8790D|nr:AsmA-like C-terminal region-containing protein [Campylobacter ureolyticus]MCZ6105461.1 AsmA-like C-terminal region-containing protein [Campylobacter ureolyticus]MCZ6158301.1 AsmA-like C-terminal region-containing protein [Campylobacter ureolyticus]GKH60540.1 hypothetical protein CE91St25_08760 [Campylobacter ureolyticus]